MPPGGQKRPKSLCSVLKAILKTLCLTVFKRGKKKVGGKSDLWDMVEPAGIEPASVSTLQSVLHT